ncbi:hypothetical protein [Aromatoleum aromaticum]|uniref:Uncharacterized protein n=1 Tax=Aromatoleum aromaticum (strain DSM 19018 / LMG 30748 / EbN1) TaxID=76114 RepID=Q5P7R6_AROAE|nr:hypothetical protein [Aromatoleum aromaticum]NMG53149.1 hypothetical protein [Aromatoleum aromaticum]CAI06645.1 hypothetical protein ebA988 [Aromatoleum aromaticum EbN1]
MHHWPLVFALSVCSVVQAAASVDVCFNYGCAASAEVRFADERLDEVGRLFSDAGDAERERAAISLAVAALHRIAGEQSPIAADRAGNFLDDGVNGRMDCIDHATTTTRLLALMASRGWLRFHRVLEPARRSRVIFQHFSALIEEVAPPPRPAAPAVAAPGSVPDHVPLLLALCDCQNVVDDIPRARDPDASPPGAAEIAAPGGRFVVDSWFGNHGEPAVVLPLAEWLNGEGPNVQ